MHGIPERYLKTRLAAGQLVDTEELDIEWRGQECAIAPGEGAFETAPTGRRGFNVPHSSLTWLPSTDLLGLPPERGGWVATPDEAGKVYTGSTF